MDRFDAVIIGSGPAGMGAAFSILKRKKNANLIF